MIEKKTDLVGLTQKEIVESMISNNLISEKEKFRAKQLWHWIYHHGETNINKMNNIFIPSIREIAKSAGIELD